jgi:hypothetical protein
MDGMRFTYEQGVFDEASIQTGLTSHMWTLRPAQEAEA